MKLNETRAAVFCDEPSKVVSEESLDFSANFPPDDGLDSVHGRVTSIGACVISASVLKVSSTTTASVRRSFSADVARFRFSRSASVIVRSSLYASISLFTAIIDLAVYAQVALSDIPDIDKAIIRGLSSFELLRGIFKAMHKTQSLNFKCLIPFLNEKVSVSPTQTVPYQPSWRE